MRTQINYTLLATTALVAVAAGAHAQVLNTGSITSAVLTSASEPTTRQQGFSGSARVAVATGPAIEISNTGAAVISLTTGAIVSSSAITGTIALQANTAVTGITINNSGTIINSNANGVAISATSTAAGGAAINVTINNAGTITGSASNGSISTGAGNDTLNNTSGTISGLINLGAGANTININGGSVTGNMTTTGGQDTLNLLSGGLVTGDVNLGDGDSDTIINASTLTGNLTTGTGADDFTIAGAGRINGNLVAGDGDDLLNLTSGGLVSGTIDLGNGTADAINISGTTAYTTLGSIAGAENVNISNTLNLRHGLTGASTLRVGQAGIVNVSNSFNTAAGGAIISSGTLRVGAGVIVSAATANMNGGRVVIDVTSATSFGKLVVGSGTAGMSATSYTIALGTGVNFIASGTALTIVDGSATATLAANSLTNAAQQGVHTFALRTADAGNDIQLVINRVSTSSLVTSLANQNLANALDALGNSVTGTLVNVQGAITQATSAAAVNAILESLAPGLDGMGAASVGFAGATGGQVSNRLASLRTGVATGDGLASRHMWLEGFGSSGTQEEKKGVKGYEATGAGVTIGLDSDELVEGSNVGAAFSYGQGTVESDAANRATTDINSYIGTLYGSKVYDTGVFVNGQLGLGMSNFELERTVVGTKAKAETEGLQGSAKLEAGRDFALDAFTLTPMLGAQYTYLDVDGYTETGAGAANLVVNPDAMSAFDLTAGVRAAYTIALSDGGTLRPNARIGVTNRIGDTNLDATTRFSSGGSSFKTPGLKAERTSFNAGAGLLLGTAGGMDISADYDADIRSSFTGHTGKLKARFAF